MVNTLQAANDLFQVTDFDGKQGLGFSIKKIFVFVVRDKSCFWFIIRWFNIRASAGHWIRQSCAEKLIHGRHVSRGVFKERKHQRCSKRCKRKTNCFVCIFTTDRLIGTRSVWRTCSHTASSKMAFWVWPGLVRFPQPAASVTKAALTRFIGNTYYFKL